MSIEKNGRDDMASTQSTKAITNGASDPAETMDSTLGDTPIRSGHLPANGSTHAVSDTQPTRRPIIFVKQPDQSAGLHVGKGMKMKGVIASRGVLMIEDEVEAEVTAELLQIANGGLFHGKATVEEAEIDGRFEGTLRVSGKIIVRRNGRVAGRLSYGQIEVERGAEIRGRVAVQFGPRKRYLAPMMAARKAGT